MIAIVWEQLPIYAARCIGAFVDSTSEEVVLIRIPTNRFPIQGAAEMTHTRVIDVCYNDSRSLRAILPEGRLPDIFVCGGWGERSFVRWIDEVRANGGRTIVCTDEPIWPKTFKEMVRKLRFRLLLERRIDRLFVVGEGGIRKFVDWYGVPRWKVETGLYAGDPVLFFDGAPLSERPRRFVYVGHFEERKNVVAMCEAFSRVQDGEWSLDLYGAGPLEAELRHYEGEHLHIRGYLNADQLGDVYRNARCLVLGSHQEHWGVVVHEACLCGCLLLLSNAIGARFDFACPENAVIIDPKSVDSFAKGFASIMGMTDKTQRQGQSKSLARGDLFSPTIFAHKLSGMIADLHGSKG